MLILLVATLVSASATPRPITTVEKRAVSSAVKELLKDPTSAQFQWYRVADRSLYCARVNAKNSRGGYTGYQAFIAFADDKRGFKKPLVPMVGGGDTGDAIVARKTVEQCLKAGYRVDAAP